MASFFTKIVLIFGFIVASTANSQAEPIEVKIWMKAFISDIHQKEDPRWHDKDWYLNTPNGLIIKDPFGRCFSTDDRNFSESFDAAARITFSATVLIEDRDMYVSPTKVVSGLSDAGSYVNIGETHKVDCKTGETLDTKTAKAKFSISEQKRKFKRIHKYSIAAGDPFNIVDVCNVEINLGITYDVLMRRLVVNGDFSQFPSYEMYYQINDGEIRKLLNFDPNHKPISRFDPSNIIAAKGNPAKLCDKVFVKELGLKLFPPEKFEFQIGLSDYF